MNYEIDKKDLKYEAGLPTFAGYGSPVNKSTMRETLEWNKEGENTFKFIGNYTNDGDFVGEALGGNKGDKGQSTVLDKVNIINGTKLFTDDSPHSNYECNQLTGANCGDRP
jgi:hypothetical protein